MLKDDPGNGLLALLERQLHGPLLRGQVGDLGAAVPEELWTRALLAPLRDFLGREGKNFRARMVSFCWSLAGRSDPAPEALGLILEYVHAGSLIIDDIQDGSLERRGGPSLHQGYGVPLALCVGNWLYFFPFAVLRHLGLDPTIELELYRHMTAQMLRCHYGQSLDLTVRSYALEQARVPAVVAAITDCKTAALFELAAACGALPAGARPERLQVLTRFGARLGRALQHLDDLGSLKLSHRSAKRHEDLYGARATYAWALLAELFDARTFADFQARARRSESRQEDADALARDLLSAVGEEGAKRVQASLDAVLGELRAAVGPS